MHHITFTIVVCLLSGSLSAQQAAAPTVDYREYQSPIRNQVDRGTCTAFAVVAAMETFPGVPNDLSEQYIYAMAKMNHYAEMEAYQEGAPLSFYVDILNTSGTVREEKAPYNPNEPIWEEDATAFEAMKKDIQASLYELLSFQENSWKLDWNLLQVLKDDAARDVETIKSLLDQGVHAIPVGYGVSGKYWFASPASLNSMIDPSDFINVIMDGKPFGYEVAKLLTPKLNQQLVSGEAKVQFKNEEWIPKEGHAVAIVGYNNSGFLIKNSWGTDWGQAGYGWVSFDYHEIFCSEALVIRAMKHSSNTSCSPSGDASKFQLKVTPYYYESKALKMVVDGAELSLVWTGDCRPKAIKAITYKVLDANGKLVQEMQGYVEGIFQGQGGKMGFPANGLSGAFHDLTPKAYTVVVDGLMEDGTKFSRRFPFAGRENRQYP